MGGQSRGLISSEGEGVGVCGIYKFRVASRANHQTSGGQGAAGGGEGFLSETPKLRRAKHQGQGLRINHRKSWAPASNMKSQRVKGIFAAPPKTTSSLPQKGNIWLWWSKPFWDTPFWGIGELKQGLSYDVMTCWQKCGGGGGYMNTKGVVAPCLLKRTEVPRRRRGCASAAARTGRWGRCAGRPRRGPQETRPKPEKQGRNPRLRLVFSTPGKNKSISIYIYVQ